jgi:filamentous hemagglutinin family protein
MSSDSRGRPRSLVGLLALAPTVVVPAELPVPCLVGTCGANVPGFVASGTATATQAGNTLTVEQASANAVLNWRSFNISRDGTVTFRQPDSSAIALNRIYQGSPSRIFGALNANGRVFLVNQSGIVFGEGAQVNVGGLVASSLDISRDAAERGIAAAAANGSPAFQQFADATTGEVLPSGAVVVQQGATIHSPNGQVLMFAPEVVRNDGSISTPDGQTMLAAGRSVFLTSSTDPNLRGLLVEVNDGGTVFNGGATDATNNVAQIVAERGNVTLAGLAVNQQGRVTATTSVRANGSIRLQARDTASINVVNGQATLSATRGGQLTLGLGSQTKVSLDNSTETAVDVTAQPRSLVELDGRDVQILAGAQVAATSGEINVTARVNSAVAPNAFSGAGFDDSRIYVAPGASFDVSGARIELPMERNLLRVELRGSQLADSPLQRNGPLRGQTAFVDVRRSGVRADGTRWVGTPLADLEGDFGTIQRNVAERSLVGGTVRLQTQGSLIVDRDSRFDLSGGQVRYLDGFLNTSQLLTEIGMLVDIGDASADMAYRGIANNGTVDNPRWGVTQSFMGAGRDSRGTFEAGYVEGRDAGTLAIAAPRTVFDGRIVGETTRGRYQRQAPQPVPTGQLYRSFDQVPLGARMVVGLEAPITPNSFLVSAVTFADGLQLPNQRGSGGLFDPRTDSLTDSATRLVLRPELFGEGGVSRLRVFANNDIELGTGVALRMPAAGEVSLTARRVRVAGTIDAPSGTISLRSLRTAEGDVPDVSTIVDSTARLSARGSWVNDNPLLLRSAAPEPVFTSGGSITVQAQQGDALLLVGSEIDVTGGLWRRADGTLVSGRGGSVTVATSPISTDFGDRPAITRLDGRVLGHSFGAGGTLAITASGVCIAARDCSQAADTLWLPPDFLQDSGFGNLRITSNLTGLSLTAGTELQLVQRNRQLSRDAARVASGTDLTRLSNLITLPLELRTPVNLTLNAAVPAGTEALSRDSFARFPELSLGPGAAIFADPLARIALQSSSRIVVDGRISAPGGTISADLTSDLDILRFAEFLPSQGIWLGSNAVLDVSGFSRVIANNQGVRSGSVFDGGRVSLRAVRGSIITQSGSVIDASGTQAAVDLRQIRNGLPSFVPTPVASNGGAIDLQAAESIVASGTLRATPGAGRGATGGQLRIALDPVGRTDRTEPGPLFPTNGRVVRVSDNLAPVNIGQRRDIPEALYGTALISAQQVEDGGFASLSLIARNLLQGSSLTAFGSVAFDGDVTLSLPQRLSIDSPNIIANGIANLSAPYVALGNADEFTSQPALQTPAPVVGEGDGRLTASGSLIELIGNTTINGAATVSLLSSGDIRVRGVLPGDAPRISGSFAVSGDLTLQAQQVYPSTYSLFTITADARPDAVLRIESAPGERSPVLSAGGTLQLAAPTIVQGGALVAPFGQIVLGRVDTPRPGEAALGAAQVQLLAGSVTSTSAAGLTIPFGTLQGGFDWVYELPGGRTAVFDGLPTFLPAQSISLFGRDLDLAGGAVVDISGGGDMLAYEFIRGVGGTRDVLGRDASGNLVRPNQFAVLPVLSPLFAWYDTREYVGSALRPGDSVYLTGSEGLAEGVYALLPARYALLPGAYLVTLNSGFDGITAGESFVQPDGSTVVAGYRTFLDSGSGSGRFVAFNVRRGADVLREAEYQTTLANGFFSRPAIADAPAANTRRPADAGLLAINAGESLRLDATLRASAAAGGRGSGVDLSAERLRVVERPGVAPDDGSVVVEAASLRRLGADSILLGGTRAPDPAGVRLTATARELVVDEGAQVEAGELTLLASESLRIASGTLLATTAGARADTREVTLLLARDGALVRLSAGPQAAVVRSDVQGLAGTLELESGATIRTGASLLLDATGDFRTAARFDVAGASLGFAANRINLGDTPAETPGLALVPAQFAGLGIRELSLTSRDPLQLFGDFRLDVAALRIDTSAILGGSAGSATLAADTVMFGNRSGREFAPTGADPLLQGLTIVADEINFAGGNVVFDRVGRIDLQASNELRFSGDGVIGSSATIDVAAPRVTADSGVNAGLTSLRSLTVAAQSTAAAPMGLADLGARVELVGESVTIDSRIEAVAGAIDIRSTGLDQMDGVTIGSRAVLNVAGSAEQFDGQAANSPAGSITIQSLAGDVQIANGATLDASAAVNGDAGSITLAAARGAVDFAGVLRGHAVDGFRSGRFTLDAQQFGALDAWSAALNAGGFFDARSIRLRGPGDLEIGTAPEVTLRANEVHLTADAGAVRVLGPIDARGADRARVSIAARDDILVSGQVLASTAAQRGGQVELMSSEGGIRVTSSATIDVGGAERGLGGRLALRTPRAVANTLADSATDNDRIRLDGRITGAERITLEGFQTYEAATGVIGAQDVQANAGNSWFADAASFADGFERIRAGLGFAGDQRLRVVAGVDVFSPGDLRLTSDWNLFNWRSGDSPGVLTLRAGGNLLLDRSISDGFSAPDVFTLAPAPEARESWSYRLVGGADVTSARPTSVLSNADLAPDAGDVRIAAGRISTNPRVPSEVRVVRTGTGDIEIFAARDFSLGNSASVVYTAGIAGPGVLLAAPGGLGIGSRYPVSGGDISIDAGRDVLGAPSNQLVTDWLWRTGRPATTSDQGSATGWTVNFQRFLQNVGALAGGHVDVRSGRDIVDFSANIPSIGRQVGGTRPADSRVAVVGGGLLRVDVGRDLLGGSYYVGLGSGFVRVGGSIGGPSERSSAPDPVFALGEAQLELASRGDLRIASIVNPTLLFQGSSQQTSNVTRSVFSTYGDTTSARLTSTAGSVVFTNDTRDLAARFTSILPTDAAILYRIYPPSLFATAFRSDIELLGTMSLYPAPGSNVELFAHGNLIASSEGEIEFLMSNADPNLLPRIAAPQGTVGYGRLSEAFATGIAGPTNRAVLNAETPVHAPSGGALYARQPVRLVARTGDVSLETTNNSSGFFLPKAVRVVAGRDIRGVRLEAINLASSDVSSLIAGRDVVYESTRTERGLFDLNQREIAVNGPGFLEVIAGRNVDLRTSSGISTRGNTEIPSLPREGANISVLTGVGAAPPRTNEFIRDYVERTARHDDRLFAFLSRALGSGSLSKAAAIAALRELPESLQLQFAQQVLFAELRSVGREAARTGSNDFRAAYAALEALFPGSNPEPSEANAYRGDLSLFFSRIYTLGGGDISLLAPGGQINAGLATPPAAFGINKLASQLGIVAQGAGSVSAVAFGDFQVNESRVFAADGGDILIWATRGDIDAGRGAKTAISAPPPTITTDANGRTIFVFPAALQGSGIQTLATSPGVRPGDVDLFAPRGVVNAGDAGIVAGNLTIAATAVLGANNIQVSGASVGVPVSTSGLAAGLAGVSNVASGSAQAAATATEGSTRPRDTQSPLADQALGFLDVFLEGFGEEVCKPNDIECLKRNKRR